MPAGIYWQPLSISYTWMKQSWSSFAVPTACQDSSEGRLGGQRPGVRFRIQNRNKTLHLCLVFQSFPPPNTCTFYNLETHIPSALQFPKTSSASATLTHPKAASLSRLACSFGFAPFTCEEQQQKWADYLWRKSPTTVKWSCINNKCNFSFFGFSTHLLPLH